MKFEEWFNQSEIKPICDEATTILVKLAYEVGYSNGKISGMNHALMPEDICPDCDQDIEDCRCLDEKLNKAEYRGLI